MGETLPETQRKIEALERELDGLSYGVSHDLRSPLRAVIGFARMLEEDQGVRLDADGRHYLQVIRDSAGKLEKLIDGLAAYLRFGCQPMQPIPVDMTALAHRAMQASLGGRAGPLPNIVIHDLPQARGDPDLLYYVWNNLTTNALTYTGSTAAPYIEIGGSRGAREPTWYIRDNGAGFDMRYAPKLFGMFQRLHSEREFPGVGTGLAIVRRIVNRHGGRVWAEGSPGQGACFYFSLPELGAA